MNAPVRRLDGIIGEPERPGALVAAVQAGLVQPRTVIWRNEAQLYLSRPTSASVWQRNCNG